MGNKMKVVMRPGRGGAVTAHDQLKEILDEQFDKYSAFYNSLDQDGKNKVLQALDTNQDVFSNQGAGQQYLIFHENEDDDYW